MTDQEYLKSYNVNDYDRPSVTVDILIFSISADFKLQLLLIERKNPPFIGKWAIPGGFVKMEESLEEAALRELQEETGVKDVYLEQLYTFGNPRRDPRTRVISVAYMALVPMSRLTIITGEEALEAAMFDVERDNWAIKFTCKEKSLLITEENMAFDHKDIIRIALNRLVGKLEYTDIAFELLKNKNKFTSHELRRIHESILGCEMDIGNFRRTFNNKYLKTGKVQQLEETDSNYSKRPAVCYSYIN